jgi:hypothetical protein
MDEVHPTLFAYVALVGWPLVAIYLYKRLPVAQATIWTILGGYLLLPSPGFDIKFPMIPSFNRHSIPNLAALLGCALYARRPLKFFHGFGLAEVMAIVFIFGPFVTSMLNGDAIHIGKTFLPGVGPYDAGSAALSGSIELLSFFLARQFLRNAEDTTEVLRAMVIGGLAYSLPMLFEMRMTPQLSNWIYGYEAGSFLTDLRAGGSRPEVFLGVGLTVAFFAMTTAVAAAALWRTRPRIGRFPLGLVTAYLSGVLALCQTLSSLVYGVVAVPLVRWTSPRFQLCVACVLVTIALAYPVLRVTNVFPTTTIIDIAHGVSQDRGDSLNTRFSQEDVLLAHAWERPIFGWGRYGRSRVYGGWQGGDSSITDGFWIITLGQFGIVGFLATFGLMALPVFRAAAALKFAPSAHEKSHLAALALIIGVVMIDQLPNGSFSTLSWMLVGALLGRAEALRATVKQRARVQDTSMLAGRSAS